MDETDPSQEFARVFIGDIPIMLKSNYCHLSNLDINKDLASFGECEYDEGGYFIVKGNERVLIAQGIRMADLSFACAC